MTDFDGPAPKETKTITCPKCMHLNSGKREVCSRCGIIMKDYVEVKNSELGGFIQLAKKSGDWSKVPEVYITREAAGIILTTTFEVAGRRVQHEIEILTAECVYGMNIFRDFFAGVRDVVGGRSAATQKVLRDARRTCLTELRREALMIGADAVIGVNLAYSEFSGAGLSGKTGMLFLVASGTAVKLRKDGDTD